MKAVIIYDYCGGLKEVLSKMRAVKKGKKKRINGPYRLISGNTVEGSVDGNAVYAGRSAVIRSRGP